MEKLVSVIIPMYNAEKYISTAINSVVNQSYKNVEIIVVNDGSKDNSYNIVKENFGDKAKLITQENGGVSSARNTGLDAAEGEYIMFLDSDDSLCDDAIEKCVESIIDKDQVIFNYNSVNENIVFQQSKFKAQNIEINSEKDQINFVVDNFSRFKSGWTIWNRMFKKDIIDKYNIRFSKKYNMGEDQLFCLEYLLHSNYVKVIEDKLYNYFLIPTSITHVNKLDMQKKGTMFLDRLKVKDNPINALYYFYFLFSERKGKKEIVKCMKETIGLSWKKELVKATFKRKYRIKMKTKLKILKNVLIDIR